MKNEFKWVYQDSSYALGNWINVTPIVKYLYITSGKPVPVFFETEYVKQCYEKSKYITILDEKPSNEPYASSSMINRKNTKPDYQYAFELATGVTYIDLYRPFIDEYNILLTPFDKFVLVMNGTGSQDANYISLKDPGTDVYKSILTDLKDKGHKIVFTGSDLDLKRMEAVKDLFDVSITNNIKASLDLVYTCDMIITNDTGLAHAAGCFDKKQFIMWKDTKFIKNMNSGKNNVYSQKNNWISDFSSFLVNI